jgi:hypothetical protein
MAAVARAVATMIIAIAIRARTVVGIGNSPLEEVARTEAVAVMVVRLAKLMVPQVEMEIEEAVVVAAVLATSSFAAT